MVWAPSDGAGATTLGRVALQDKTRPEMIHLASD